MYLPRKVEVNSDNHLVVAGVDLVDCASRFGTPLYVYNEELIRLNCRSYKEAMTQNYPRGKVAYAGKAFLTMAMCRLLKQECLCLDVVSAGELHTAYKAGFPLQNVYFHGNNKESRELKAALELGVGMIVVDNLSELHKLAHEAENLSRKTNVMLRVKPGINVHTHKYIKTGQEDSKFGLGIGDGQALKAAQQALASPNLHLCGLHCHLGSQIFDFVPYKISAEILLAFMSKIREKLGVTLGELNLGGGLGVKYTREDPHCSIDHYLKSVCQAVYEVSRQQNYPVPVLTLEPGRSIIAEAGITLYTVGAVKDVPGIRRYIMVDGGMSDNLRVALYGARYEAALANRAIGKDMETVTVAGKACESGDILMKDVQLPTPGEGDILAVFNTGAYNYSMFCQYNRHLRPAVVFLSRGNASIVSRRETLDDLLQLENIPD